jgi:hypothetical protein
MAHAYRVHGFTPLSVTLFPPLPSTAPPYLYPGSLIRDVVGDWVIRLS